MFFLWSSDLSPARTHSPSSRFPICIVPADRYVVVNGVNLTLQAVAETVTTSFNKLATKGIPLRDLPSLGGGLVVWAVCSAHFSLFVTYDSRCLFFTRCGFLGCPVCACACMVCVCVFSVVCASSIFVHICANEHRETS